MNTKMIIKTKLSISWRDLENEQTKQKPMESELKKAKIDLNSTHPMKIKKKSIARKTLKWYP